MVLILSRSLHWPWITECDELAMSLRHMWRQCPLPIDDKPIINMENTHFKLHTHTQLHIDTATHEINQFIKMIFYEIKRRWDYLIAPVIMEENQNSFWFTAIDGLVHYHLRQRVGEAAVFLRFPCDGWEGRVSLPEVSIIAQVWDSQLIHHFRSQEYVFAISYFPILIVVQDFTKTALKFNIIENHYVPREKKCCEKYENLCLGTYHEYRRMENSNFPAAILFRKQPKLSNSISIY